MPIYFDLEFLWTQCPKSVMARDTKKVIHIFLLKYLTRFTHVLLKSKGNSNDKFCTLDVIWDIRAIYKNQAQIPQIIGRDNTESHPRC